MPAQENVELARIKERIHAAEKAQAPVARESIGLDAEGYDALAVLIERGLGRKPDVLRQALSTGLRVLKNSTAPNADENALVLELGEREQPFPIVPAVIEMETPIITPPSIVRRRAEGELGEESEDEEDEEGQE